MSPATPQVPTEAAGMWASGNMGGGVVLPDFAFLFQEVVFLFSPWGKGRSSKEKK